MGNEAAVFIEEVPEYVARDGRVHITFRGCEIVMPIRSFLLGCEAGKAAIEDWMRSQRCEIIALERRQFGH